MKVIFVLLFLIPTIIMTSCEEDCLTNENPQGDGAVEIISLTPLEAAYTQGTVLTLKIDLPSTNGYFGDQVNLFDETGDDSALITLGDDELFVENFLTFIKGSQGEYSNWFFLPYNPQTGMYELVVQITLDRTGTYSHEKSGRIYLGPSDPTQCVDFLLTVEFANIDGQFIEFTVNESSVTD